MADHYIGANRGAVGFADANFTYGTSSGATDVELRIADAAGWTRKELVNFLKALEAQLTSPTQITGTQFPPI